ncbi:xanthine dehydrogenase family protein molybdopterin-binding subunit [bacterium]|nr:xanthine dehydrogenase family protein molybdopterin-binding subunit [bacterium]
MAVSPDGVTIAVGTSTGVLEFRDGADGVVSRTVHSHEGRVRNPYLSTYLIPTILDVPAEVHSIILEYPDPIGPWGARGMAEMPMLPLLPAVAAAIHDATGVWMTHQPFTPDKVVAALRRAGVGKI